MARRLGQAADNYYGHNPQQRVRLRTYGITQSQYDEMFDSQGRACAVCRTTTPTSKGWNIDHCHNSGVVRGILCSHCNMGLGQFRDDVDRLMRAAEYLAGWELTTAGTAAAMTYVDDILPGHRRRSGIIPP
jgi:hypothetical protein